MKAVLTILAVFALIVPAGCSDNAEKGKLLLSVDFQKDRTLRYNFVSSRDIEIDWAGPKEGTRPDKDRVKKFSEVMEIVVAYRPIEVDPYGLTTIQATCESVRTTRYPEKGESKEAAGNFAGKTFTLTVGPAGRIEDYSQLEKLIKEVGGTAFRTGGQGGRIKEPDMICDLVSTQWFLWDSISSIENPSKGVLLGQSWKSKLSVPTPMITRNAREVIYTLAEIRPTEKGQIAVIRSAYSPADSAPNTWPIPYSGSFQMSGTFGFFRNYKMLDLQGQGEELFNIDAGRTEQYNQTYQVQFEVSLPLPMGVNPKITIKQKLSMKLLTK